MKHVLLTSVLLVLTGCSTIPYIQNTTRPERVVLTQPAQVYFDPGPVRSAAIFDVPAGVYSMASENEKFIYYRSAGATIKKTWTRLHGGSEPPRIREGGLMLVKNKGDWSVFMLVTPGDLEDDKQGGIGLLTSEKIDGKYVQFCASIGRVDESGSLVHLENGGRWGYIDDLSKVKFEGSIPIKEK